MKTKHTATFVLASAIWCLFVHATVTAQEATKPENETRTPVQHFFEWTSLKHDASVYRHRRGRMIQELGTINADFLIIPGLHGRSNGGTFRQTDDFMYFTGLELPRSILVMDVTSGYSIVFAPRQDVRFASTSRTNDFPGRPLADDPEIARISGLSEVRPYAEFEQALNQWIAAGRTLAVNLGNPGPVLAVEKDYIMEMNPVEILMDRVSEAHPGARVVNAFEAIARLRMVKQPEEIEIMRNVATLTTQAIRQAAGLVRDGVDERTLEAELEAVYKRGGAQRLSFSSIIKSGPNSLWPWRILAAHYDRRNRIMHDGDLVIFDVGTELDYYVSDVGRTFPVSGTFTEKQAQKLTMITAVSDAIIRAVRPGITLADLYRTAVEATPENERKYMQTGSYFGHHIGMSAGDPSLMEAPLEPGMVFTVEPWYYNHDDEISVFIEDVILVTENGSEVLTSALPRHPDDLEKLVARQ